MVPPDSGTGELRSLDVTIPVIRRSRSSRTRTYPDSTIVEMASNSSRALHDGKLREIMLEHKSNSFIQRILLVYSNELAVCGW